MQNAPLGAFCNTVIFGRSNSPVFEHHGSLELIHQSLQIPYISNVKIHIGLEQRWLELKTWTAGQFLTFKRLAGLNHYLPNMNHSGA